MQKIKLSIFIAFFFIAIDIYCLVNVVTGGAYCQHFRINSSHSLPYYVFASSPITIIERDMFVSLSHIVSEKDLFKKVVGLPGDRIAIRDQHVFIADAMFKYVGWGLMAEYFNRSAVNPITENAEGLRRAIWIGEGANFHLSRMVSRKSEIALRYAFVSPDEEINRYEKRAEEAVLGFTRYLHGHRIKLQGNFGYSWFDAVTKLPNPDNFWFWTFQVEFGI